MIPAQEILEVLPTGAEPAGTPTSSPVEVSEEPFEALTVESGPGLGLVMDGVTTGALNIPEGSIPVEAATVGLDSPVLLSAGSWLGAASTEDTWAVLTERASSEETSVGTEATVSSARGAAQEGRIVDPDQGSEAVSPTLEQSTHRRVHRHSVSERWGEDAVVDVLSLAKLIVPLGQ